ncbi:hypothetical protein BD777DRAFT_137612 [Yarrowia lipolytica]|nr:hypothetical protein BD777DRAFT_137612 [Yarrowia lipolytica]
MAPEIDIFNKTLQRSRSCADGLVVKSIVAIDGPPVRFRVGAVWLRPYPGENTAFRPISHSQAPESLSDFLKVYQDDDLSELNDSWIELGLNALVAACELPKIMRMEDVHYWALKGVGLIWTPLLSTLATTTTACKDSEDLGHKSISKQKFNSSCGGRCNLLMNEDKRL